ncbi:MAG: efflux RND transporter permease subunit, partial [Spirochaetes bacterium]|nr:efflux RND transporter permease subunit [Spirochaetota bacterium]
MKFLIKYFISKPWLVNLITFFVIFSGIVTLSRIRKEGYPVVDQKMMRIMTFYPGASPEDVELNVTIPLEKVLKEVDGIDKYTSSSFENYSTIWVYIDKNLSDPEKVKADIRRAVDSVSDLPEEIKNRPNIWEWKSSNFTVFRIAIYSDTLSRHELRTRSLDLEKKLLTSPYVSQINSEGKMDREIHVKIDLNKLNRYYLSFEEVIDAIRSHNIQITGGTLDSYTSEKTIVTLSKFKDIMDVKNVIIRSSFEGQKVVLKDIAQIENTFEEEYSKIRANGRDGIFLNIKKKETADIIKTVDNINKLIKEFKDSLKKEDINIVSLWDLSEDTRTRLDIVQNNALIGFILVVITLLIFLNFKNALWTALGIPFSISFALILFPAFGVTVNSISLLGIIVVLGMIVDDAIIISENIFRHRIEGEPPLMAGIKATEEVAFPVLSTVMTTIVAFIPILYIEGMVGDFSKEIPLVIGFILIGSLIESLFILPNHVTHSFSSKKEKKIE